MPTLKLMSIYKVQKRKYADDLRDARADLEQARASLPVRFGTISAAIRTEVFFRDSGISSGATKLSEEELDAVENLLTLKRRVRAVCRQIHVPGCSFREGPQGVSVWETLGRSWDDVWRLKEDGRLPVSAVLQLLAVVRSTKQVLPTEERLGKWTINYPVEKWWRLLRHRRRRLLCLLETAAELEEELVWETRW